MSDGSNMLCYLATGGLSHTGSFGKVDDIDTPMPNIVIVSTCASIMEPTTVRLDQTYPGCPNGATPADVCCWPPPQMEGVFWS